MLALILRPWRWLKNRRFKPGVLLRAYMLLGLDPGKSRAILAHKFDTGNSEYLLAEWQETYIVARQDRIIGRAIFCTGEFELDKAEKARALLGQPTAQMVFVDIGANIGTMCIPVVARGHFAKAIAIEPEPLNARLLRSNLHLNGLADRIEVFEAAAGARPGRAGLFLSASNFGDHFLKGDQASMEQRGSVQVDVQKLDDLIPPTARENLFLWLDTQGFEGYVLKGAGEILSAAPPMVLEFAPSSLQKAQAYAPLCEAVLAAPYTKFYDLAEVVPAPRTATKENLDMVFDANLARDTFTDLFFMR